MDNKLFRTIRTITGRPPAMDAMTDNVLIRLASTPLHSGDQAKIEKFVKEAKAGSVLQLEWLVIVCVEDIQPSLLATASVSARPEIITIDGEH